MSLTAARLKRLVRYRERLERLQEQRLGRAVQAEVQRAAALATARDERLAALDHYAAGDLMELSARIDYLVRADRQISARGAALAHASDAVAGEREELLAKSQDRKAMETMRDHRMQIDRLDRQRKETKQLDDVAGRRWLDRER